jgi:hypothetical protein
LLKGTQTKTTFFSAVWQACGLGSPINRKLHELQTRVESFLGSSGMMLVIDEAHRLFPQTERMYSHPELINWLYTMWDIGVPVALCVTPQFITRMDAVEQQTDWRSGQLKRRIEKWENLPSRISEQDILAVACRLAPGYSKTMIEEAVDFAMNTRRQLDALKRALSAADQFAAENGRTKPTAADLQQGIKDAQSTDLALTTPLDLERQSLGAGTSRRGRRRAAAATRQPRRSSAAELPQQEAEDTICADRKPALAVDPDSLTPRVTRPGLSVVA